MKNPDFLPRIESLRGIAAPVVVGYHVGHLFDDLPGAGALDALAFRAFMGISNGIGAVVAFFVLSGFVLARSLDRDSDPVRYFRNRVFRLFPAAIAVVGLLAALYHSFGIYTGFKGAFDPLNVVLNMLMIRSDINGPMWSMTVECFATPLIFLSVMLFLKRGALPVSALIVVLFGLSFWGPYTHLLGGVTNLAPLYAFVVGVLAHFKGASLAAAIKPKWAGFIAVLTLLIFCFCGLKKQTAPILMLECLSAATFVVLVVWHPASRVFNPLDFRWVRFYGEISYSFYLLHMLGILFAGRLLGLIQLGNSNLPVVIVALLTTFVAILLVTPAAYLSRRLIEVPSIALGRRFRSLSEKPLAIRGPGR